MCRIISFIILLVCFFACSNNSDNAFEETGNSVSDLSGVNDSDKPIKKYLLTGHTYSWARKFKVDQKIESIPKGYFDGFWIGGDVLAETLLKNEFIDYLDQVFDLKNPMTHIAYGNHDARNAHKRYFNAFRNRPDSYYSHTQDGLCFLILDSTLNPSDCRSLDGQYQMIKNVCDTISDASHLLVLIHDSVWEGIPGIPPPKAYAHGNQKYWNANCASSQNTFANTIYPHLKQVQKKGINVICMMGDTGWKKGGAYISEDSIQFLSSGINNSYYLKNDSIRYKKIKRDKVFVFSHDLASRKLGWQYIQLDSLPVLISQSATY